MKKIFLFTVSFILFSTFIHSQINLIASQAEYFSESEINLYNSKNINKVSINDDILPVKLSWTYTSNNTTLDKTSSKIIIYFSEKENGPFTQVTELPYSLFSAPSETVKNSETFNYFFENKKAVPSHKYYFKISLTDSNNNVIEESNIASGWGALSHETYFMLYNKIITISHNKLVLMNKKKTLDKLGHEIINGDLSGTLEYKTAVKGLGGLVTMNYVNYADNQDWTINGSMNTKANMSANGTMYGTIEITGMYPGKIFYENVIITDGKAGGGTYDVQPLGQNLKQLEYTITFKNIDDFYSL